MKTTLKRINANPLWIFSLSLLSIWGEVVKPLLEKADTETFYQFLSHIQWFNLVVQLIIVSFLYKVYKSYYSLKLEMSDKMIVFTLVSFFRQKRLFIKHYEEVEFTILPYETDEEYWNRLPEGGLFKKHMMEEYELVRNNLRDVLKNRTTAEVDALLDSYYPKNLQKN